MDYRIFEAVLDPVIVIAPTGEIQYLNPMAIRWLGLSNETGNIGSNLARFVQFRESEALKAAGTLAEMAHSGYHSTSFTLTATQFSSEARLCLQRLPGENGAPRFAIFIRDRAFVSKLMDEQAVKLTAAIDLSAALSNPTPPAGMDSPATAATVLNQSSMQALSPDMKAPFVCRVNAIIIELAKAVVGESTVVSSEWIEFASKPLPDLEVGMNVNLDVAGNLKLRGFATKGEVVSSSNFNNVHTIRVKLTGVSGLARRSIDEYLELHAKKHSS